MDIRFYVDPESQQPHIYNHGVTEEEVYEVLVSRGDDFQGKGNSRIRFGQTMGAATSRWCTFPIKSAIA